MTHHSHHHRPSSDEQEQIESDEALAARLQAEESQGYTQGRPSSSQGYQRGHSPGYQGGPPQGYQGRPSQGYQGGPPSGYQGGPPHGYQAGPPSGYQGGPPQGYQGGPPHSYQGGPPSGYQGGPPQGYQGGPPSGQGRPPQGYQGGPPSGYQGGPPQGYQGGPQHSYQGGPPQSYQGGPPSGQGRPPQGYQGGPPQGYQGGPQQGHNTYVYQGPQPEYQGQNQYQGQTQYQGGSQHGPYPGGPPSQAQHPYQSQPQPLRRKSLLIGINYVGSQNALRGCHQDVTNMTEFLKLKGYSSDQKSQIIMRDDRNTDPNGPFWPTGKNMLAAMHWLVSEPNTCNFLHYSGHGSQVKDPDGDRDSGFDDTIVPVDFQKNGQIDSDKLHRLLVSALPANSTLFVIFDCCHSGSAIELPFVYRSDADGNVSMMDNVETGMELLHEAGSLLSGGFTMDKLVHAKSLFSGASLFFKQLQHAGEPQEEGVGEEHFVEDWKSEHKFVTMFSGCRDDQTSADASIAGSSVGAMSWAFLETMKKNPNPTYLNTLQQTRETLGQSNYKQVPQLSIGFKELDLNQPLRF